MRNTQQPRLFIVPCRDASGIGLVDNFVFIHTVKLYSVIAFRVSRRRREMYTGHARLSVCVSVCPSHHSHTTAQTRM